MTQTNVFVNQNQSKNSFIFTFFQKEKLSSRLCSPERVQGRSWTFRDVQGRSGLFRFTFRSQNHTLPNHTFLYPRMSPNVPERVQDYIILSLEWYFKLLLSIHNVNHDIKGYVPIMVKERNRGVLTRSVDRYKKNKPILCLIWSKPPSIKKRFGLRGLVIWLHHS